MTSMYMSTLSASEQDPGMVNPKVTSNIQSPYLLGPYALTISVNIATKLQ